MKRFRFIPFPLLLLYLLIVCNACQENEDFVLKNTSDEVAQSSQMVEGIVRVKIKESSGAHLNITLKSGNLNTGITTIDTRINTLGIHSFKRTFPFSGKYEPRSVAAGLHLWYDIKYDTALIALDEAVSYFKNLSDIEATELIPTIQTQTIGYNQIGEFIPLHQPLKSASLKTESSIFPYNDPLLNYQWNYYNSGAVTDGIAGADINLFNAWSKQSGQSTVIVGIIDGGIDIDHEDLTENIWLNSAENTGTESQDDDNNGYQDDINGYNFVRNNGTITQHDHGTHVAGIIGARNNNGIGVCGVAGGDATHKGVQLMSCQVFQSTSRGDDLSAESFAEAIKYAADNGAVICQNSWGYDNESQLPQSMKEAIDYFVEYAGIDENGNQVGPMKGGVVIFAAGNESRTESIPASYSNVISVAASVPDFTIASYSNYGSWVDITAPGGTEQEGTLYNNDCLIASTLPDNTYGYSAGTSMACPHVSGVAALIISEYGGADFTPEMLKARLFQGATDITAYNANYTKQFGAGLINAAATLANYDSTPPEVVTNIETSVNSNTINASWLVTPDEEDVKASSYILYYSTEPFSHNDIITDKESFQSLTLKVANAQVGDTISAVIEGLRFNTTYYMGVVGNDILGAQSNLSEVVAITTLENRAPIVTTAIENNFTLKSHETVTYSYTIYELDNHNYTWQFKDTSGNSSASSNNSGVNITISALQAAPGEYSATLLAEDEYGASTTYVIYYTILENYSPVVKHPIEDIYIGNPDGAYTIQLSNYFSDEDGEVLSYSAQNDASLVRCVITNEELTFRPQSNGLSTVTISAKDARGETCSTTFQLMIRDDSKSVDIYPNPITDVVNIRMGADVDDSIIVSIYNTNNVTVKSERIEIAPFAPGKMNLSHLASGNYILKFKYGSEEIERNIVKL